jgi:hypothetical protein
MDLNQKIAPVELRSALDSEPHDRRCPSATQRLSAALEPTPENSHPVQFPKSFEGREAFDSSIK